MKCLALCLAAAVISGSIAAQKTFYIPSNTPGTGTCNVIPFGTTNTSATWKNQRYQTLVTPGQLNNNNVVRICSLAFSPCGVQVHQSDEITITMAHFTPAALTTNFVSNLAVAPVVVLKAKCHIWQTTANGWSNIGLDKTYVYIPARGNLVIDILIKGNHRKSGSGLGFHRQAPLLRLYAFGWPTSPPATGTIGIGALKMRIQEAVGSIDNFGMGCGPGPLKMVAGGNPKSPGGSVSFNLSGGPNTGVGFIWIGLTKFPNPINLSPPYTGCKLNCSLDFLVPVTFTNGRSNGFRIPIPGGLACFQFCAQGLALQNNAPGGISVSDCARILLGL